MAPARARAAVQKQRRMSITPCDKVAQEYHRLLRKATSSPNAIAPPLAGKGITHSSDKVGRIQALEALISAGKIRFSRRHQTLIDQLRRFPHAAHDDGPDALEMAVKMVKKAPMAYGYMFEKGCEW